MAAFLPKYLESQFSLTSETAAVTIGLVMVPAAVGGTLFGSYLMKRLKLTRSGAIKMYLMCQTVLLPLYFGLLYHCPTERYHGLTYPSGERSTEETTMFRNDCNAQCSCPMTVLGPNTVASRGYSPVCGLDSRITYYSSCHAGCQYEGTYQNRSVYFGCICVGNLTTNSTLPPSIGPNDASDVQPDWGIALKGACSMQPDDHTCNIVPFLVILFLQLVLTFMSTMPGLVASLRSVDPSHRSIGLGCQTMLLRAVGTVPGPVVFGSIIDKACILWGGFSASRNGEASCKSYDHTSMASYFLAIMVSWRTCGTVIMSFALYFSNRSVRDAKVQKERNQPNGNSTAQGQDVDSASQSQLQSTHC